LPLAGHILTCPARGRMELDAPTRGGLLRDVAYGTGQQPRGRPLHPQGGEVASGIRPAKISWTGRRPAVGISPPPSVVDEAICSGALAARNSDFPISESDLPGR
jgi:hypothetical protein